MQDDKAVEELVVVVDGACDGRPAFGVDGAAVEQFRELVHGVADATPVGSRGRAETGGRGLALMRDDCDALWTVLFCRIPGGRLVVERGDWGQTGLLEPPGWDESRWRWTHADRASRHDNQNAGFHCSCLYSSRVCG